MTDVTVSFFYNAPATTAIYPYLCTISLQDARPISAIAEVNPIWLPASLLGGLFQAWRTALQERLRAELSVSGAGLVRYLYGLPFAILFAVLWLSVRGDSVPPLTSAFLGFAVAGDRKSTRLNSSH